MRNDDGEMYFHAVCEWPNKKGHWTWDSASFAPDDIETRNAEYERAHQYHEDHIESHSSHEKDDR